MPLIERQYCSLSGVVRTFGILFNRCSITNRWYSDIRYCESQFVPASFNHWTGTNFILKFVQLGLHMTRLRYRPQDSRCYRKATREGQSRLPDKRTQKTTIRGMAGQLPYPLMVAFVFRFVPIQNKEYYVQRSQPTWAFEKSNEFILRKQH